MTEVLNAGQVIIATEKPKIYVIASGRSGRDIMGTALAEDGNVLAGHMSSNEEWLKHDLGVIGDWHHDEYAKHYTNGFEVVWVPDSKNHEGTTKICMTFNTRSLHNFFNQRTDQTAQWEIRAMATEMLRIVKKIAPDLFYQFTICEEDNTCTDHPTIIPVNKHIYCAHEKAKLQVKEG